MVRPPFLSDMCSIIISFPSFTYGISNDIEKAFLNVVLDGNDRDFTRCFWLSDSTNPEREFQVFRFKTVLFGSTSSPFMLNATLHHHLEGYSTPVAEDIRNNMYVDNVISGCDQETDIISYYQESRSIMNAANFNLRSWACNSPQLREKAEQDQTADTSPVVNILGLRWHPVQDTLSLTPQKPYQPSDQPITKRCVLQISSKTYDPLGLSSRNYGNTTWNGMNRFHRTSKPNGTALQKIFKRQARLPYHDVTSPNLSHKPPQPIS